MFFGLIALFACLPLLWFLDYRRQAGRGSAGLSLLRAGVLLGALIVLINEVLSGLKALTPRTATILWVLIAAALLAAGVLGEWRHRHRNGTSDLGHIFEAAARRMRSVSSGTLWYWGFLIVWFATLLLIALVAAPNNFDSMTYRLPRVMHWADNQSIEFYPTGVARQNGFSPYSEWVLLHIYLMTVSDRFFNVLQWLSFAGVCVAVSEIAGQFSTSRIVKRLAVILAATTPLAILQATNTQNDVVVSFFFLCFLLFGLRMSASETAPSRHIEESVFCGLALGLALVTKTTMFLFAGVFSLWFAWRMIRQTGWKACVPGAACGIPALLIISSHSLRNFQVYGSLLGPVGESDAASNQRMTPAYFASNVIRNVAMLCQNPISNVNDFLNWAVSRIHDWLGLSTDERDITHPGSTFTAISELRHEDWGGYPLHIALIAVALVMLPFLKRRLSPLLFGFGISAVSCLVLFWLMFRWQAFHSRFELPLVLALLPMSAAVLFVKGAMPAAACAGFFISYGLPFVIDNHKRPLFGQKGIFTYSREMQYSRPDLAKFRELREIARRIKLGGFTRVGVIAAHSDYHYPLWPLLRNRTRRKIVIYDVNVRDSSAALRKLPCPEAVVVPHATQDTVIEVEGRSFDRIWGGNHASLFARREEAQELARPEDAQPVEGGTAPSADPGTNPSP